MPLGALVQLGDVERAHAQPLHARAGFRPFADAEAVDAGFVHFAQAEARCEVGDGGAVDDGRLVGWGGEYVLLRGGGAGGGHGSGC